MFNIVVGILLTVHVIICVLLVLIVLMQRPRSEGLGTAFGGGVTDTLFGSSAGNVLTKITTWLGIIFFATTISLALLYSHRPSSTSNLSSRLKTESPTVPNAVPPSAPVPKEKNSPSQNPPAQKSSQ